MAFRNRAPAAGDDLFLPDFCGIRMVFAVVIVAQLFAFLLVLAPLHLPTEARWRDLGLISLFVQWAALASCAVLCVGRPWLSRLSNAAAGAVSYGLILVVLALVTEAAAWVLGLTDAARRDASHWPFLLRNLSMGAIIAGLALRYFYVQHQWKRNLQAETQARLAALQARIRPHFLFNSMNTIASLTRSRPEQAEAAVEDLADLFRMSLREAAFIPLGEELALCRRYLNIEALRLGERLAVTWDTAELPADAQIPPLTLQPLLENAIYHGIEPRAGGGTIKIQGRRADKGLEITISNPVPEAAGHRPGAGNRMALSNTRERLAACFGPQGTVQTQQDGDCYRVVVSLPYRQAESP